MDLLKQFIRRLDGNIDIKKHNVYVVGGYIRDKLIGKCIQPRDVDIVYDGDIVDLIHRLNSSGYRFSLIKESMGVYRSMTGDGIIDVSRMKGNTICEDLSNRDFTVNAICMKLGDNKIIDPLEGRKALKNRIIKAVDSNIFKVEPIRILRAARMYIKYGFHFNADTERMLVENTFRLEDVAGEKIFSELMLILKNDKSAKAFEMLDSFSILKHIVPYVDQLKTIGKCRYHVEDVFTHVNLTYMTFKDILDGTISIKNLNMEIFKLKIGDFSLKEYMSFACFLHDIGKYKAYKKENGNISFRGHERKGMEICRELGIRLKMPGKVLEFIETMVYIHMLPLSLFKKGFKNSMNEIYDFFYKYYKFAPYVIVLSFCDNYATMMLLDKENQKQKYKEFIECMLKEYDRYSSLKENKIVDGNYIKDTLNVEGAAVGNIIYDIGKMRYFGRLNTQKDVAAYIDSLKK